MENFITIISSNCFANICQFFSAFGTVSAVALSLFILLSQRKVKFFINKSTLELFSTDNSLGGEISGYSATICNASNEKNIYLKQGLYVQMDKPDLNGNCIMIMLPIIELNSIFPIKKVLGPGEDYTFFISEKHIKNIINNTYKSNIICYFMDKFNRKYKFKIKRKDLKNKLDYINKNRECNNILSL